MYFDTFPKILYDSKGNGQVKIVTNLLKRVAIRTKVKNNTSLFLVTHNESILSKFDRVLNLENGTIS